MTESEFIAIIAPFAVADMQQSNIPSSLSIAQAALESGWVSSGSAGTPSGGSYDFYRTMTMLYGAGLFAPKKEV